MKLEYKNKENFCQIFISFKIPFIPKTFRLNAMFYNTPETWVHGYSSRTKIGRYCILLDYDNLELIDLIEEIKALQHEFKLSNFHIFQLDRENSYHAVCLDTFSLISTYSILKRSSSDQAFINSIKYLKTREWILRFGPKGKRQGTKYLMTLKSKHDQHLKSTAHALMLKKIGIIINLKKGEWDKETKLGFVDYNTSNRTEEQK